ncbi:hypothetical protein BpHYR1_009844 [Brachionus plicatilis]|uniref:Uncharacterized protein n=1 Tax=Brachionus plicatilis TaxID=10195 RepID=A0A3M7SUY4_BRAPC|nr:hypothetical protein BpHYR1_009844 [Brachionus plicatilis]
MAVGNAAAVIATGFGVDDTQGYQLATIVALAVHFFARVKVSDHCFELSTLFDPTARLRTGHRMHQCFQIDVHHSLRVVRLVALVFAV